MNSPHSSASHHQTVTPLRRTIDVQFVLSTIICWWKLAIPCGLLLAGVSSYIVYALFVPEYQAACLLRISSNAPYIVFRNTGNSGREFYRNQVELIRSHLVLGAILDEPEVAGLPELRQKLDPVAVLVERISVSSIGGSDLFEIAFTSTNPAAAAAVANLITDSYFQLSGDHDSKRVQRVIDLLDEESQERQQGVVALRENVRELAKDARVKDPFTVGSPTDTVNLQHHPLANLASRITTSEVELAVLEAQMQAYQEWMDTQPNVAPGELIEQTIEQQPQSQKLKAQIALNQSRLSEYEAVSKASTTTGAHQHLQREIERDKKALEQMRAKLELEVKQQLELEMKNIRLAELDQMRVRSESLALTINVLQQRYEEQLEGVQESSSDTINLEFKQDELRRAEEVLERIDMRILQLRTERRAPERVELLADASKPTHPVVALPYKMLVLVVLFSLCAPFALAVGWEYRLLRVSDAAQLERIPNLAVLGEIASLPLHKVNGTRTNARVSRELFLFEESINSLRTGLVLAEPVGDLQVLAVTSATTREGKTSVATQLAVSIAQATGEKTLLIDGDMRIPDIHSVFEVPLEPGFSKLLDHQCTLDEAVVTTWGENLHILPAGVLHASPHKLLGNGALKSVLDEARQRYRYIVIDTPPVLAAGEALVLAKAADESLLCAMRNVSRLDKVRSVFSRLLTAGANPRGVVLSGVATHTYIHSYGHYGYSKS